MKIAWMLGVLAVAGGMMSCGPEAAAPEAPASAEEVAIPVEPGPEAVATGGLIRGQAVIEMRNETVRELAGLELVLLPEKAVDQIRRIRNERWRMRASRFNFDDGYNNLDIQAIGATAVSLAVAEAKADEFGIYAFPNVPPGRYQLYAQYRSMYAVGYWLLPVEVEKIGQVVVKDLSNENFAEVFNYQQKR